MKIRIGVLIAFIAFIAFIAAPAIAADIATQRPIYKAPPPPVPIVSWTGFYLGGSLGARWTHIDGSVTSELLGTPPVSQFSGAPASNLNGTAFRAGGFAGWNW